MADASTENLEYELELEGDDTEIELVDDTPEEDRGREPLPHEIVQELEADELEDYSEKVKIRLKQMKKVWHDERRAKEKETREKAEALSVAQRLLEENRKLKSSVSQGETALVNTFKQNAEFELAQAKREYRDAYEAGDTDKLLEAQEKLNRATFRQEQLSSYRPTLQDAEPEVQQPQQSYPAPQIDQKTSAWQERNTWFGTDPEMTALALGLHQRLEQERGPQYTGTDEYWSAIDTTMRRRFPEYFGEEKATQPADRTARATKPATVVAPAARSSSPKRIKLTLSQQAVAKRLGLTPEQYIAGMPKSES